MKRKNIKTYTRAETVAKTIFASKLCGHRSINEMIGINSHKNTNLKMIYKKNEYIPSTHGLRDAIIDTDYKQIEDINKSIILKAKENKIFRKNTIDGLCVSAWDGVESVETRKNISGLPEREYEELGEVRKYVKYLCGMQIGPMLNVMIAAKQLQEVEKIKTKTGNERAKTIGETTAFKEQWNEMERLIGKVIDVHVFDALYLTEPIITLINKENKYFVIRMKDETRELYKDAKGLFDSREADYKYELVEIIITKNTKYTKKAKKKNTTKTKTKIEKRKITDKKLGEKKLISTKEQTKKNSIVITTINERVVARKEVWSDEFDYTRYNGKVRVVRSKEEIYRSGKISKQELYVASNMLEHDVETILKIMHYRWNIENNGFRTLKQRYNFEHIFIGELNAINYMVQMIFMAFNLLELYMKVRLSKKVNMTWNIITRIFENSFHSDKNIFILFNDSS